MNLETMNGTRRHILAVGAALMAGLRAVTADAQAAIPRYTFLRGWGGTGATNGRFDGPRGVAVFANRVYIADTGNDRLDMFTTSLS